MPCEIGGEDPAVLGQSRKDVGVPFVGKDHDLTIVNR